MADRQYVAPFGAHSAPASWLLAYGFDIPPKTAYAKFDGTNAAGSYWPCLRIISDSGHVVAECVSSVTVAAGASADVSWFQGEVAASGGGGGGGGGTKQVALPMQIPDSSGNGFAGLISSTMRGLFAAYTNGVDGFWYGVVDVPEDYKSAGAIVLWAAANDTGSKVTRWIVGTRPGSTASSWNNAYTAETAQNLTMSNLAYLPTAVTFTLSTTPVAGQSLAFYVERNGSNAADTLTVAAYLFKAVFQYSA